MTALGDTMPERTELAKLQARFARVELKADVSNLPKSERAVLAKLIRAAQIMDTLFLRQIWAGNESLLADLARATQADCQDKNCTERVALARARWKYFMTHKGPWDRSRDYAIFIPGAPTKPPECNFYPAGATKAEVEAWIDSLPDAEKARAMSFFTTLRRAPDGKLTIVPYSVEYQNELSWAGELLREAATLTLEPSLKRFLTKRADSFLTNDYYDSDVAWMELDSAIEPTIGPYENYEDEWFNYKAAFEAFVTVRDDAETAKLERLSAHLQDLEDNLPIDKRFKNPKLGALAPIRVVNQVFAAGDGDRGVKTAAYNLPNDEKVTREKGSKRTMLKNVQEAKFQVAMIPIARLALTRTAQANLDFGAFFTFILMHEIMHGLGPHETVVDGKKVSARKAMKELSSAMEEAKADISGLWAMQRLIDRGVLDKRMEKTMYDTFLVGAFRSIRFGISEAHGRGMAMQLNYLIDHGGVRVDNDGLFLVDKNIKGAVESLTREIMTVQAHGDYAAAKSMLETLGTVRPEVKRLLDRMTDIPIDIDPRHVTAEALLTEFP